MTGVKDITQLCFYSNLAEIVANKIEQSFYSVYSYSGIESIKHTLILWTLPPYGLEVVHNFIPIKATHA